MKKPKMTAPITTLKTEAGMKVRFSYSNLGSSERDELSRVTSDVYNEGDTGVLAFPHPNQKACSGWWYVEVDSKSGVPRKLYVAVSPKMIEAVR